MNNILKWAVWPVLAAPFIYLAIAWKNIPAVVPVHFDIHGNADRFGPKKELLLPVIALSAAGILIYFILSNIYRLDPKKYAAENKSRLERIGFITAVFLAAVACMVLHSAVNGGSAFSVKLICSAVGILFACIGNYMPNMKPNYFAGFRLPWTLENEQNWRKTHALAGKYWFGGGLLIAVICLFVPPIAALIVLFSIITALIILPVVYSYKMYKLKKLTDAAG